MLFPVRSIINLINISFGASLRNDFSGDANNHRVRWNIIHHNAVRTNGGMISNVDVSQDFSARTNKHIIADGWISRSFATVQLPDGYPLRDVAIVKMGLMYATFLIWR